MARSDSDGAGLADTQRSHTGLRGQQRKVPVSVHVAAIINSQRRRSLDYQSPTTIYHALTVQ